MSMKPVTPKRQGIIFVGTPMPNSRRYLVIVNGKSVPLRLMAFRYLLRLATGGWMHKTDLDNHTGNANYYLYRIRNEIGHEFYEQGGNGFVRLTIPVLGVDIESIERIGDPELLMLAQRAKQCQTDVIAPVTKL